MHIAILGATSQIARDLVVYFDKAVTLYLFCRNKALAQDLLTAAELNCKYFLCNNEEFFCQSYDAVINFIGSGNPAKTASLGTDIFEITHHFDSMVMKYLNSNPACRYIFISSGAAFGDIYSDPLDEKSHAIVDLNNLKKQDWYGVAKLYAECQHRARSDLSIVDLRVFSYFSKLQDIDARFFLSDIARAILNNQSLLISSDTMDRDYIHPSDLFRLVQLILLGEKQNIAYDCFSNAPISKFDLIEAIQRRYGLKVIVSPKAGVVNATGSKSKYYSLDKKAASIGYRPRYDSLEGVLIEMDSLLELHSSI